MNLTRWLAAAGWLAVICGAPARVAGQAVFSGRVLHPRFVGAESSLPLTGILCFASPAGSDAEPLGFRTWETAPVGWYRMTGGAGRYTLLFSTPAHFMRPVIVTNQFVADREKLERIVTPTLDFAVFDESSWDDKAGTDYFQPFVARGRSVTQIGFRLAHDGVDGGGPGRQTLVASIHRQTAGAPETGSPEKWPQVGPSVPIVEVDSGGPKNYLWSAGWNSGEAPLEPGKGYAVRLRAEQAGGKFQPFWRPTTEASARCYRVGGAGPTGFVERQLWLAVSTDGDGLVIPYNKRVHRQFNDLTNCVKKWSQTYVAQGRGLAAVVLYAAVSGAQPPLSRQRVVVRVREGGPTGPQVGSSKIAIGNGNYTGDASWGTFGTAFAPGEVSLTPGKTYAIEFESLETYETLHGFVNIKGQISDGRPGFNPYKKHPRDAYDPGTAYRLGGERQEFDLDLQVIEYEHAARDWATAVEAKNLLANGDMQTADDKTANRAAAWRTFAMAAETVHLWHAEGDAPHNRVLRVAEGTTGKKLVDGGFVQRVGGLSAVETYRLAGRVRCSWPRDDQRSLLVGYDPTGQDSDPQASTIVWTSLPKLHGIFVDHEAGPLRPARDAVSVWLRGRSAAAGPWPFKADFDDFSLRQRSSGVPGKSAFGAGVGK